jgi:hypothetical protein
MRGFSRTLRHDANKIVIKQRKLKKTAGIKTLNQSTPKEILKISFQIYQRL